MLGPDHPNTLATKNDLALVYGFQRNPKKVEPLLKDVLDGRRNTQGADHRETLLAMANLASFYNGQRQPSKAEGLLVEALERCRGAYGPNNPDTLWLMQNLGALYRLGGNFEKAAPLLTDAMSGLKTTLGADHTDTLQAMSNLANLVREPGKAGRRRASLVHITGSPQTQLGRGPQLHVRGDARSGRVLSRSAKYADAEKLFGALFEGSPRQVWAQKIRRCCRRCICLANVMSPAEELDLRRTTPEGHAQGPSPSARQGRPRHCRHDGFPRRAPVLEAVRPTEAEPLLRECLEIREKTMPNDWLRFHTEGLLGACLVGEKKYEEAEPPVDLFL